MQKRTYDIIVRATDGLSDAATPRDRAARQAKEAVDGAHREPKKPEESSKEWIAIGLFTWIKLFSLRPSTMKNLRNQVGRNTERGRCHSRHWSEGLKWAWRPQIQQRGGIQRGWFE